MSDHPQLERLFERWLENFRQGRDLAPSDLSSDAELAEALAQKIAVYRGAVVRPGADDDSDLAVDRSTVFSPGLDDLIDSDLAGGRAISYDEFVARLGRAKLMAPQEVAHFCSEMLPENQSQNSRQLVRALIGAGKLTTYQTRQLVEHHTPHLVYGEYVIVDELGSGGVGRVFKAVHQRLEKTYALKVLHQSVTSPSAVRRFEQEIRAAAQLDHPNIVRAVYAGQHEQITYLVMDYVPGQDLSSLVRDVGPSPPAQALTYTIQAGRGLAYAHGQGVVHRDVKPGNLLVDSEGNVKILDLGLVRMMTGNLDELTRTGVAMGSVLYMAPEQARDSRSADHRADIYSLGCTLYHLLTGKYPFPGSTQVEAIMAHSEKPIPQIREYNSQVTDDLQQVFARMVAKRVEDRYPSMQEAVADLQRVRESIAPAARSAVPPHAASPSPESTHADTGGGETGIANTAAGEVPLAGTISNSRFGRSFSSADTVAELPWQSPPAAGPPPPAEKPSKGRYTWLVVAVSVTLPAVVVAVASIGFGPGDDPVAEVPPLPEGPNQAWRMAAWTLNAGGRVRVKGATSSAAPRQIDTVDRLPRAGLKLVELDFAGNESVDDDWLSTLGQAGELDVLDLSGTSIGDAGLDRLAALSDLSVLDLTGTQVTIRGLEKLSGLGNLRELFLGHTNVDSAALVHLRAFPHLEVLSLEATPVASTGLSVLSDQLRELALSEIANDHEAIETLARLTRLERLLIANSELDSQAIAVLAGMPSLRYLALANCQLEASGVAQLADLPQLEILDTSGSNVDAALLANLSERRPNLLVVDTTRSQ